MSLINDALRRAKQAHKETPTPVPPAPNFKPVESAPTARQSLGVFLPAVLAVVALLTLLLLWELWKKDTASTGLQSGGHLAVSARTPTPDNLPRTPEPSGLSVTPPSGAIAPVPAEPKATTVPGTAAITSDHPAPGTSSTGSASETNFPSAIAQVDETTNHPAAPAPSAPAPLKLQGIVYNPRRPSALINGRVMFVGDRIRDLRVMAIHQDEVLLIGGNRTNLLSLEP